MPKSFPLLCTATVNCAGVGNCPSDSQRAGLPAPHYCAPVRADEAPLRQYFAAGHGTGPNQPCPAMSGRDLKPANCLLSNASSDCPVVKLSDFGLSRIVTSMLITQNPEAGTVRVRSVQVAAAASLHDELHAMLQRAFCAASLSVQALYMAPEL
jgi:hypothetical protein